MNTMRGLNGLLVTLALGYGAGVLTAACFGFVDRDGVEDRPATHLGRLRDGGRIQEAAVSTLSMASRSTQGKDGAPAMPQRSPFRVTSIVLEARLIRWVQPVYPQEVRNTGRSAKLALDVVVNEKGEVAEAKVVKGDALFNQAAIDAVKQWRFSSTVYKGEALPVVSLVILDFKWPESSPDLRIRFDPDGSLKDLDGRSVTPDMLQGNAVTVQIPPGSPVAFATMEAALRQLQNQGIGKFRLLAPSYRFVAGRLFYETMPETIAFTRPTPPPLKVPDIFPAGTRGFGLGIDQDVRPAVLNIDMDKLTRIAKASAGRYPAAASVPPLRYRVCVNESGEIVAVEKEYELTPEMPEVISELKQAVVSTPGQRLGKAVPTAVPVTIPIR